jgi:hypothetical protein
MKITLNKRPIIIASKSTNVCAFAAAIMVGNGRAGLICADFQQRDGDTGNFST